MEPMQQRINEASQAAKGYMEHMDPEGLLTYHNWRHVDAVMCAVRLLAEESDLDDETMEDMLLAASWHDADYFSGAEGHEQRSAKLAREYLEDKGLDDERLDHVERLILATRMDAEVDSLPEKIMKDSDIAHLSQEDYMSYYFSLYQERSVFSGVEESPQQWKDICVDFMGNVKYLSPKGMELFEKGKDNNLQKLKNMDMTVSSDDQDLEDRKERKRQKKERKAKAPKFNAEKGIETMFRVSLRNHINLSRIADDKANTLISVNAIILSIVLSALFPKLDSNPFLIYPGLSLILVSIVTIITATLSTIPKTTHGSVSREDVEQKRGNLLFFGNFHSMSLEDYEYGMRAMMIDGEYLYGSLTRDLYFLGKVLNRKYALLRYAYLIFTLGLIISIVLFVWSILTLEQL